MDYSDERRATYLSLAKRIKKFDARIVAGKKLSDEDYAELNKLEIQERALRAGIDAERKYQLSGDEREYVRTPADRAFANYLRNGIVSDEMRLVMGRDETRADGVGISSAPNDNGTMAGGAQAGAGYMVPQGFWANLQIALRAYGGVANDYKQVMTDTGQPMPWPAVDPTAVSASLVAGELNQMAPWSPYVFGQGMLNAWTCAVSPILVSVQLVQDSQFDVDQFVSDRMGEAIGRSVAQYAITGTGVSQPLGLIPFAVCAWPRSQVWRVSAIGHRNDCQRHWRRHTDGARWQPAVSSDDPEHDCRG